MEQNILGLVKIHARRGFNLAARDAAGSDPYCVFTMGSQKVKTRAVKDNSNPEWNDDVTMYVKDLNTPVQLTIFDKDTFTVDDKLGDAEFDLKTLIECLKKGTKGVPDGCRVTSINPGSNNCLAEQSCVYWRGGKMVQDMRLKLRNIESGEVELQLEWVDLADQK